MTEQRKLDRVYVEIGNVCNLACSFCPGTKRPLHQMTEAEFQTVCERLRPHTDYLYFHVMGEPLLHPSLDRFLRMAGECGFRVCITTNGTLLSSEGQMLLSHADVLHKVSISLHSLEGNGTVSGQEADCYLSDAITFAREASALGIHTVLRLWNLDADGREGRNLANSAIEARLHEAFPEEWKPRWNGFRLKQSVFLEYAGIFTWPTESDAEATLDGYCHGLLDQLAVLADGTVTPCCLDSEGEIALGNLYRSTLPEILAAPRATAMWEGFSARKMVEPLCQKCTYARRFRH